MLNTKINMIKYHKQMQNTSFVIYPHFSKTKIGLSGLIIASFTIVHSFLCWFFCFCVAKHGYLD